MSTQSRGKTAPKRPFPSSGSAGGASLASHHRPAKIAAKAKSTAHLSLPVHSFRKEIVEAVRTHRTTVVVGETGSGKSTQLPQILLDSGLVAKGKAIVCTQPRRVAAVTIAQKVASERNVAVGQDVGYSIRFEDQTSPRTRIKYATDGVLLREWMGDPLLSKYSIVILDEAHERSLQTDILIGLLKTLQSQRKDDGFRIVIMSATLQVDTFKSFFDDSCSVVIPGRQFPVDIFYLKEPESDFVEACLLACMQLYEQEEEGEGSAGAQPGGVLVFLPGQEDIESLQQLLLDHLSTAPPPRRMLQAASSAGAPLPASASSSFSSAASPELQTTVDFLESEAKPYIVRVLYAAMPSEEQLQVFAPVPPGVQLFILATNIAETSLTISGIKYVVDSGFVKMRLVHPVTGFDMLKTTPVSKSQANQRAGRAGRECAGKCFRLYTEATFEALSEFTVPEVQRIDLSQVLLQLMAQGIKNAVRFPWLTMPHVSTLKKALETLLMLGALDQDQNLTAHGQRMARLPLHPSLSHLLLASIEGHCSSEALTAVALLSAENVFVQPYTEADKQKALAMQRSFASVDGDLCTMINIYNAWLQAKKDIHWTRRNFLSIRALRLANNIRDQLLSLLKAMQVSEKEESCWPQREPFLRCLVQGLYLNVAQRVDGRSGASPANVTKDAKRQLFSVGRQASMQPAAPYETLRGRQPVYIHPTSGLFALPSKKLPAVVVYAELLTTSKQYMRNVNVIEASWLPEIMPQLFEAHKQAAHAKLAGLQPDEESGQSVKQREEDERIRRLPVGKVLSVQR